MLWIGVTARNIYKQVTKKPQPCQNSDQPSYPKQPLLRYGILSFSFILNVFLKLINFKLSLSFLYSLLFFQTINRIHKELSHLGVSTNLNICCMLIVNCSQGMQICRTGTGQVHIPLSKQEQFKCFCGFLWRKKYSLASALRHYLIVRNYSTRILPLPSSILL